MKQRTARPGARTARISAATDDAKAKVQASPAVAGLVAFGAGAAVAAVLPPSRRERRLARELKQRAEPLKENAVQLGRDLTDELQRVAQERVDRTKQETVRAVWDQVRDQAKTTISKSRQPSQSSR